MSIFVDETTKVVYQGLTGSQGRFYGLRNRDYGTQVVAGTNPKTLVLNGSNKQTEELEMAVQNGLTVENLAHTFSVYPSLSGSITESGRQLMRHGDLD